MTDTKQHAYPYGEPMLLAVITAEDIAAHKTVQQTRIDSAKADVAKIQQEIAEPGLTSESMLELAQKLTTALQHEQDLIASLNEFDRNQFPKAKEEFVFKAPKSVTGLLKIEEALKEAKACAIKEARLVLQDDSANQVLRNHANAIISELEQTDQLTRPVVKQQRATGGVIQYPYHCTIAGRSVTITESIAKEMQDEYQTTGSPAKASSILHRHGLINKEHIGKNAYSVTVKIVGHQKKPRAIIE